MYTSLLCLIDYVFNNDELLQEALDASLAMPHIRKHDLIFHDELHGWSDALLFDNVEGYNTRHARMTERLSKHSDLVQREIARSKEVVALCRAAMKRAQESGHINAVLESANAYKN